jgi:hypothetical protein
MPADGAAGRAQVTAALRYIKTAAGTSALDRMSACGFRIQWKFSWVAPYSLSANTDMGVRVGDTVISVEFDRPAADPLLAKDNLARWFVKSGKLVPDTGWAREIQNGPYPINRDGLSRC